MDCPKSPQRYEGVWCVVFVKGLRLFIEVSMSAVRKELVQSTFNIVNEQSLCSLMDCLASVNVITQTQYGQLVAIDNVNKRTDL